MSIYKHAWKEDSVSRVWFCTNCHRETLGGLTVGDAIEHCLGGIYEQGLGVDSVKPHEWVMTPDKNMCKNCDVVTHTIGQLQDAIDAGCTGERKPFPKPKGDSVKAKHVWVKVEVAHGEYQYECVNCGHVPKGELARDFADADYPCKPAEDKVNHPSHYTSGGGIECIDAIEAVVGQMQGLDAFYTAQVLKYLWRWPLKGGVEDLLKAKWYLERLIAKKESK